MNKIKYGLLEKVFRTISYLESLEQFNSFDQLKGCVDTIYYQDDDCCDFYCDAPEGVFVIEGSFVKDKETDKIKLVKNFSVLNREGETILEIE